MRRYKSHGSIRPGQAGSNAHLHAKKPKSPACGSASLASRILQELRNIKELPEATSRIPNAEHIEQVSTLSIYELCTLCTKASNTYHLTDRERAEQVLQILLSIEGFLQYLSVEKLQHIGSKLKILNGSPCVAKLIACVEEQLARKNKLVGARKRLSEKSEPAVRWNEEYESSVAFSSAEAYRSYRKSRDLITTSLTHLQRPGSITNPAGSIRAAIQQAATSGNLVKLAWFIVLSIRNSSDGDHCEAFITTLAQESRFSSFSHYLIAWIYHFLTDEQYNVSSNKENIDPKKSAATSPSSKLQSLKITDRNSPSTSPESRPLSETVKMDQLKSQLRLTRLLVALTLESGKSASHECLNWRYSTDSDITDLSTSFHASTPDVLNLPIMLSSLQKQDARFSIPWISSILSYVSPVILKSSAESRQILKTIAEISANDKFLSLITQELPKIETGTAIKVPQTLSFSHSDLERSNILEQCSRYWRAYNLSVLDLFTKNYASALASSSQVSPVYRSPTKSVSSGSVVVKARKVSLKALDSPATPAARRINLSQPNTPSTPTTSLKSSSLTQFRTSPTSSAATPLSADAAIERAFLRAISPSVERALTACAERIYSNTIRKYRLEFRAQCAMPTPSDPESLTDEQSRHLLLESIRYVEPVYKSVTKVALPPLLPIDWRQDRIKLAICICQKWAATRVHQWLLDRSNRLSSFFLQTETDPILQNLDDAYYDIVSARHQLGQELLEAGEDKTGILQKSSRNGISWDKAEIDEISKLKGVFSSTNESNSVGTAEMSENE